MSREVSPSTGQVYGVQRVCASAGLARSTYYAHQQRNTQPQAPKQRRGPKPQVSDERLWDRELPTSTEPAG